MLKLKNIFSIIVENIQQTEKIYFKTGLLDDTDKKNILEITNGDNFTLPVAHLYYALKKINFLDLVWMNKFYNYIKEYDKNFLPIKNLNTISDINEENANEFSFILKNRHEAIKILKGLPSIAIRNIKKELRMERGDLEFDVLLHKLKNFDIAFNSILKTKLTDKFRNNFLKTIFKSSNDSFDKWFEEVERFDFDVETMKGILNLIDEHEDLKIVAKINNCLIVKVTSLDGIAKLGCNSLWCFSKPNAWMYWLNYSYHDMVYVVIDFNLETYDFKFMTVFTWPLEFDEDNLVVNNSVYDSANENIDDVNEYLDDTIGVENAKKYINFEK